MLLRGLSRTQRLSRSKGRRRAPGCQPTPPGRQEDKECPKQLCDTDHKDTVSGVTVKTIFGSLAGGSGDDNIALHGDGAKDSGSCGDGVDTVLADSVPNDTVAADCENVSRP